MIFSMVACTANTPAEETPAQTNATENNTEDKQEEAGAENEQANAPEEEKHLRIGVIIGDSTQDYYNLGLAGIKSAIKEGDELIVYDCSQDISKQYDQINDLISQQVDAIVLAVINADDYYGREAFQLIYDYLNSHEDDDKFRYTMVGYKLCNTVTENGYVSRGVCEMNEAGELIGIRERTRIEHHGNGIAFTEDDGATWTHLDDDTTVSMNMWGFSKSILDEIGKGFPAFLEKGLKENPMKCEYYLPGVVSDLLGENRATVAVLKSADKWYGVTYKEDKPVVMEAIRKMEEEGLYPA